MFNNTVKNKEKEKYLAKELILQKQKLMQINRIRQLNLQFKKYGLKINIPNRQLNRFTIQRIRRLVIQRKLFKNLLKKALKNPVPLVISLRMLKRLPVNLRRILLRTIEIKKMQHLWHLKHHQKMMEIGLMRSKIGLKAQDLGLESQMNQYRVNYLTIFKESLKKKQDKAKEDFINSSLQRYEDSFAQKYQQNKKRFLKYIQTSI